MTYFYDKYVAENYGINNGRLYPQGAFITPEGNLFNEIGYSKICHAGGFVLPFLYVYLNPIENYYFIKEECLNRLIEWKKLLETKQFDAHPKEQKMRLSLVKFLINVYKSKYVIWDSTNNIADFSKVTGISNVDVKSLETGRILKDILVQSCNYDSIESTLYRSITTSKFNIYETFYDYILNDYTIYQIPKKIYSDEQQKYIDFKQSEFLVSDKELRLKDELDSICKNVPLDERKQYCRNKKCVNMYDFIN